MMAFEKKDTEQTEVWQKSSDVWRKTIIITVYQFRVPEK